MLVQKIWTTTVRLIVTEHTGAVNTVITVSETEDKIDDADSLCGQKDGTLNQYFTLIQCNPVKTGRFVQLKIITTNFLNLYELEVIGY